MSTNSSLHQITLNEQLAQACIDFNIPNIEQLLNEGADPNFLTVRDFLENKHFYVPYNKTPLDIILCPYLSKSHSEATQVAKLLLDHGANVEGGTSGEYFSTPLHEAVDSENFSLVRLLIESGANVNAHHNDGSYTPLHIACKPLADFEIVEFLIQHGADVNNQNEYGETPSNLLVRNSPDPLSSDVNIIPQLTFLIQHGSDFSIVDMEQNSPWTLMQNKPHLKIASMNALLNSEPNTHGALLQQITQLLPQFGIKNIDELTDPANKKVSIAILDEIIETHLASLYPENILEHKLIQAASDLDLDKMISLLEKGADPNFLVPRIYYPDENASALHFLSCKSQYNAIDEKTISAMKVLLDNGANPNVVTEHGNSPLHYLVEFSHYSYCHEKIFSVMKMLLDNGANPNLVNEQGDSPLHLLAKFASGGFPAPGELEIFNLVLKNGGDINLKNHDGHTPADDLAGKSKFLALVNSSNQESDINVDQEELQKISSLIENNVEFINPINDTQIINPNNESVLLVDDIVSADAQDMLFVEVQNEIQPEVQETIMIKEANPCPPYDGYVPLFIMQWLNLEKPCDPSGAMN